MKKTIILTILAIIVLVGAIYLSFGFRWSTQIEQGNNLIGETVKLSNGGALYTNNKYEFNATLPPDYNPRELTTDTGDTIVFENKAGDGIQILISPFDNIKVLTADMIKKSIPDLKMENIQTVDIGAEHKGVAFISDNSDFGGASRDVWFVYKGFLYQISTYARLDSLLQSIFGTWSFF